MAFARKEIGFDPAPYAERLKIPVLILLGELDRTVPAQRAASEWRNSLLKAGNRDFKIEIIPGADHGLRVTGADGRRTIVPDYWGLMSTWLFVQLDGVRSE
jgi:dienelactone hydrolase